jgi:hypothetical protein
MSFPIISDLQESYIEDTKTIEATAYDDAVTVKYGEFLSEEQSLKKNVKVLYEGKYLNPDVKHSNIPLEHCEAVYDKRDSSYKVLYKKKYIVVEEGSVIVVGVLPRIYKEDLVDTGIVTSESNILTLDQAQYKGGLLPETKRGYSWLLNKLLENKRSKREYNIKLALDRVSREASIYKMSV